MIAWVLIAPLFGPVTQATFSVPNDKVLAQPKADAVVAVVNGKNITAGQVQRVLWDWTGYEVTQELIGAVMVDDAAAKAGVTATNEEVAAHLDKVIGHLRAQVPEGRTFEDELRAQGSPYSRLFLRARIEVLGRKMVLKDFRPEELRKLSRILVRPKSESEADQADAKKRAEDAAARLKAGESWDAVVQATSDDMQTKQAKGLMGWTAPSELSDAARAAVLGLKDGDFGGPYEIVGGFVIYRVEAHGPPSPQELEAVQNAYFNRNVGKLFTGIRDSSKVENRIVPEAKKP